MGRHQKRSDHRVARAALCTGVVGVGVLQAAVPALAAPAPAPAPAAAPAGNAPAAPPCAINMIACVSISQQKAWIGDGKGHLLRGPVPVTTGAKGMETPVGTFQVSWKDQYHVSREYNHAPMPYSTFFRPGVAFHGGSLQRASAGCVHLSTDDAKFFFEHLDVYDYVQVVQ